MKPNKVSTDIKRMYKNDTSGPSIPHDPYWSDTLLLLKCNDGSMSEKKGHILTNNGIVASAVEKKFGLSSCYFDGSSYLLNNSTDWNFGTSDFTVEAWTFPTTIDAGIVATCSRYSGGYYGFTMEYDYGLLGTQQGPADEVFPLSTSAALGQWNHIALVRSGGTLTYYLNGQSVGTTPATLSLNTNDLVIGMISPDQISQIFTGYIDQVRVTKNARYLIDFLPPTEEFLDQ